MATLPTITFILVAASLFAAGVEAKKPCTSYIIPGDFANKTVEVCWLRKLVKSTLESKIFCKPTPLIKELWAFIIELANSDEDYLQQIAFAYALRASILLTTFNVDLNVCVLAQGINATVTYTESEDLDVVADSLNTTGESVRYSREMFASAALSVANCKNIDPPKPPPLTCPDNGLVYYPIKKMWKLFGRLLPCCLKDLVFALYKSDNPQDQSHAVVVTSILDSILGQLVQNTSQKPVYESLYLLSITKVQKCCCDERKEFLEQITEERTTVIKKRVVEIIAEEFSC